MSCNVRRYDQKFDSDVKKKHYQEAGCSKVQPSNNDKALFSKDDKLLKQAKFGHAKIVEEEYGCFHASIEVDDNVYDAVFKDILKAYGFLVQTKEALCKDQSSKEKPIFHQIENLYFSIGECKDGYCDFYGDIMGLRFLLLVKDKAECIKLLRHLATIYSKPTIHDFILQATQMALDFPYEE